MAGKSEFDHLPQPQPPTWLEQGDGQKDGWRDADTKLTSNAIKSFELLKGNLDEIRWSSAWN